MALKYIKMQIFQTGHRGRCMLSFLQCKQIFNGGVVVVVIGVFQHTDQRTANG